MPIQLEQSIQDIKDFFFAVTNNQATKVGATSVLEGLLSSIAKTGQLVNKDVMNLLADSNIDLAFGSQLDKIALQAGYSERFGTVGSYTYITLVASPNTQYLADTHFFFANNGERFVLEADTTISDLGFVYAKVKSENVGSNTVVPSNSITKVSPSPVGHKACWNDFVSLGGRDLESDTDFRNRIKDTLNTLAAGTLSKYEQVLNKIDNRILRLFKVGKNQTTGAYILYVATVNGIGLTQYEIDSILDKAYPYFSLTEQTQGIELRNIQYLKMDIEMRVELNNGIDADLLRTQIQIAFQRKYDFRYLSFGDVIDRFQLILLAYKQSGIKRIFENYFTINGSTNNLVLPQLTLPLFRSFVIKDLNGDVISTNNNAISDVYSTFFAAYSNQNFQSYLNTF